ncbi:MAG: acyltransferase family protein [Fibrobacterota bacterium]|nr:MAG: acyltransferase family protein [Fibrobacterota bacterium]
MKAIRQDIELLRILAAFGIVWFHAGRDIYGIGYGGLVAFLILSVWLAMSSSSQAIPIGKGIGKRAVRFLVPWAFWMIVFGIRNHVIDRDLIETDRGWINGILASTNIHLWYLPYMFAILVGLDLVGRKVSKAVLCWGGAALAIVSLSTAVLWRPWADAQGFPTVQYLHGFAAVCIGVFFAFAGRLAKGEVGIVFATVVGLCAHATWKKLDGMGTTYLVGVLAVSVLVWKRIPFPRWLDLSRISQCTFGIYLVHPLFLRLFESIRECPKSAEVWMAFACSLSSIALFRRILPQAARWVV